MAFANFDADTDVLGLVGKDSPSNDHFHLATDVFATGRGGYGGAGAALNTGGAGSAWMAMGNFQHAPIFFAIADATHDAHTHALAAALPQDVSAGSGGEAGYGGIGGSGFATGGDGGNASNANGGPTAGSADSSSGGPGGGAGSGTGGSGFGGRQYNGNYAGSGGGGGGAGADGDYSTGGAGGYGGVATSDTGGCGGGGGGAGGNGLFLKNTTTAIKSYHNQDACAGGTGGAGGQGAYDDSESGTATGGGGGGGGGGNGVSLVGNPSYYIKFFNAGVITGGTGGAGGKGSTVLVTSTSSFSPGGNGGNGGHGGNGINAANYNDIFNYGGGVIRGGTAGVGGAGYGSGSNGVSGKYGAGIAGGQGLYVYNGGKIYGGAAPGGTVLGDAIDFTGGINKLALSYAGTTGAIIGNIAVGGTLDIDPGTAAGTSVTLFYAITDYAAATGNIDKTGDGTLILTGDNTYTGSTQVDDGVLKIVGPMSGNGIVTVDNSAKFILDARLTLSGSALVVDSSGASHVTLMGGYGADSFTFFDFTSKDVVNGEAGSDKLILNGDYSTGVTLNSSDLISVETIVIDAGHDYKLTALDSLLATGQSITISGSTLGSGDKLTFNGSAEKTGSFVVHGGGAADGIQTGGGNDTITGGGGADTISAGNGVNTINGGAGADKMTGGTGKDTYVYAAASDSTSKSYDTINGFSFSHDRFNVAGKITKIDTAVSHSVSTSSFDTDIAAATAGHLTKGGAILVTATGSGSLSGDVFLVIDQNGAAGYQHGHDLVIELHSATGTLTTTDFI